MHVGQDLKKTFKMEKYPLGKTDPKSKRAHEKTYDRIYNLKD